MGGKIIGVNDYLIGRMFNSNTGWFTVLCCTDKRDGKNKLFEIEFQEYNGVRYRTLARPHSIRTGRVKNPYFPSVCGVGYIGNASPKDNKDVYNRWRLMLSRCYDPSDKRYNSYGGKGVTVCDRWHSFENFLTDFIALEGYNENSLKNLSLDKDIKAKGNKLYSPETCILVSKLDNLKEMNERVQQRWFIAKSPEGILFESNNKKQFSIEHKLSPSSINKILQGKLTTTKGWSFKYKEEK